MEKFQAAKEAGFDGVEPMSHLDRKEVLKARDATGTDNSKCLRGNCTGNILLSDPDPKVREQGVEALKVTLEDAECLWCRYSTSGSRTGNRNCKI